jgi:hypothetical protein
MAVCVLPRRDACDGVVRAAAVGFSEHGPYRDGWVPGRYVLGGDDWADGRYTGEVAGYVVSWTNAHSLSTVVPFPTWMVANSEGGFSSQPAPFGTQLSEMPVGQINNTTSHMVTA